MHKNVNCSCKFSVASDIISLLTKLYGSVQCHTSLHFTPHFPFTTTIYKWKTITQIALLFLTLGKIRGVFQWWVIIKWQIMQHLDWCHNLQLLKLKPHVDISCATKYFPTLGEHSATLKNLVCVMHGEWTSYIAGKCLKPWQEACIVYMAHAIHLFSWGFVRRKS